MYVKYKFQIDMNIFKKLCLNEYNKILGRASTKAKLNESKKHLIAIG